MVRRSAAPLMHGPSPCLSLHRVDLGDEWAAHASMGEGGSPTARPRHQTSDGPAVPGIGSAGNVSVTTVPSPGTRSMWSWPPSAPAWPAWWPFRGARRRRPCGGGDRAFQGAAGYVNGGSAGGRPGFPNRALPVPCSRIDRAHVIDPCPAPRTRRAGATLNPDTPSDRLLGGSERGNALAGQEDRTSLGFDRLCQEGHPAGATISRGSGAVSGVRRTKSGVARRVGPGDGPGPSGRVD
jgi:hypothetical protein